MPQQSWSPKDERQYEHVKQSELERAPETPNTRLEDRSVSELRNRAKELGVPGRNPMRKRDLIDAIRDAS